MTDIAFALITPVILGVFLGLYLDNRYHSKFPKWTIIFTIIGFVTGIWSVYKRYTR